MARSRKGRKFFWLTAGVVAITVPLAPPGTFDLAKLRNALLGAESRPQAGVAPDTSPAPATAQDTITPSAPQSTPSEDEGNKVVVNGPAPSEPRADADAGSNMPQAGAETVAGIPVAENKPSWPVILLPPEASGGASDQAAEGQVSNGVGTTESLDAAVADGERTDKPSAEDAQDASGEWSREIASGDTLDALLTEAGIPTNQRYAITTAISDKFNLSRLRPGHEIRVTKDQDGEVTDVDIRIDRHNSIETAVGEEIEVTVIKPDTERHEVAKEVTINGPLGVSLQGAGVPTTFATEIANALTGHVDFRRHLQAGDTLDILWSEKRTTEGDRIGGSKVSYARLAARGRAYDIVWEADGSRMVFRDGDVIRTFSSPVPGARISSNYGMRVHPTLGGRRMHEGTDFAAATGTPVLATTAGVVSYVGRRGSYGRVVEVKHGPSVKTRYAHLSKYAAKKGDRVEAGERIGFVGTSGRTDGAHLHYEFLLNGRAVNPMSAGRWKSLEASSSDRQKLKRLEEARKEYEEKRSSSEDYAGSNETPSDDA